MQSGLIFGLTWSISFLCLVCGNGSLGAVGTPLFLATPFIGFFLAYKFRKDVQADGRVSYLRGLGFSFLLYIYASAVLAIVAYIYFQYFDHGEFLQRNLLMLQQPEVKQLFNEASGVSVKDLEQAFKTMTPISIVASIININIMLTIPLTLPTAFFAMTKKNIQ